MKNITLRFLLLSSYVLLLSSSQALLAAPKFPSPPHAKVTWVGKGIIWNGLPMRVRKFTTAKSKDKVIDFYKQEWKEPVAEGAPGFIEQDMPDGMMISRVEDGHLMTVHIKSSSNPNTWGYLGMSEIAALDSKASLGSGFPKMNGSKVLNEIKHNDPYRSGRTIMIQNQFSVSGNVEYYRNHFKSNGWNISMDHPISNGGAHAVMATRNGSDISLTVVKTNLGGSQIVANIVE